MDRDYTMTKTSNLDYEKIINSLSFTIDLLALVKLIN